MKIPLLIPILVISLFFTTAFAQKKLSTSKTGAGYTYVYQLSNKEMKAIALNGKIVVDDTFLHTLVDSFAVGRKHSNKLAFGNYLYATPVKNKWSYVLKDKKNVEIAFVNDKKHFQFYVKDLTGNLVKNAKVTLGKSTKAKYDNETGLYFSGYQKNDQLISVEHEGVSNFFSVEIHENYRSKWKRKLHHRILYSFPIRYTWLPFKNFYRKLSHPQNNYRGYMVFSKPKYKPLDTVKFKAFVVHPNGKEINPTAVDVVVYDGHSDKKTIATIKPYRNGAYEYSFVLADSLNLRLDKHYIVRLDKPNAKGYDDQIITGMFKYEEYELKGIDFNLRSDQKTYKKKDSVTLFLKATDENELAVPDGRVTLNAITTSINAYAGDVVFVPDTLWKKELKLEPVGETKITIPFSTFPLANVDFRIEANFLNSNNESRTARLNLSKTEEENDLYKIKLEKDSLVFRHLANNQLITEPLWLSSYTFDDELLDAVKLVGAKIKVDYRAEYYEITAGSYKQTYFLTDHKPTLSIGASHTANSARIKINNENKIPFWYTVFSKNKVLFKGYAVTLDTLFKHDNAKAVHIAISYFWDQEEQTLEASTFYNPNELNVKLVSPDMVYPGQKVNMLAQVTDANSKPVANLDVTAYANTSKFGQVSQPSLPQFSKVYYARKVKDKVEAEQISLSGAFKLSWQKWGKQLGLDTIEYYKFTHHDSLYVTTETSKKNITQIAPFVVNDGEIDPANVVYVNDIPVFFNQVSQLTSYSFEVAPGKHKIELRTANKRVIVRDVNVVAGKKTVISIAGHLANKRAAVNEEIADLNPAEATRLDKYLFKIENVKLPYEKQLLTYDSNAILINQPTNVSNASLLVGPFNENWMTYKSEDFSHNFIRESGYTYTFLPNLIKQKSFSSPYSFNTRLTNVPRLGNDNYLHQIIKKAEVDSIWNDYLDLRSYSTVLFYNEPAVGTDVGKLLVKLADSLTQKSYLKNVVIYQLDRPSFMHIYPGNMRNEITLEDGAYRIMFLMKDNSFYQVENVLVKSDGLNYYQFGNLKRKPANQKSLELDAYIKSLKRSGNKVSVKILEAFNNEHEDISLFSNKMSGRVLSVEDKSPIAGAVIKIVGSKHIVYTDANGYFNLLTPDRGKISISALGYLQVDQNIAGGSLGNIFLKTNTNSLNEVVVVGYGAVRKMSLTGSVSTVTAGVLAGRAAGLSVGANEAMIRIRGASSINVNEQPLIIIDGLPFTGSIDSLDKADLTDITVLKDASATAIYGSRAANGVIIIKTKKGANLVNQAGEAVAQQQTMRNNFSDEAFWQPKLITDQDGNASFAVKFPDDITSWNASVIAMNGKKQSGSTMAKIKSFKSLSANLVSPLFAVVGDSIDVIGKLMNYTPLEETGIRKFSYNERALRNSKVTFKNSLIDTLGIVVPTRDSLNFEYTLTQENGYFDGERRKIPVFEAGVKETKGYFSALLNDTTTNYTFDKTLGKITLRAEASVFPTLLDEMTKLRNYEYLCNEQLGSKLKSLLLEKRVRKYLNQKFTHEKGIDFILKKLQQNKKPQGTWGWWQNSDEEMWISLHVVEALIQAEKEGYKVDLNKPMLQRYLIGKLTGEQSYNEIQIIKILHLLDATNYIKDWVLAFEEKDRKRVANLSPEFLAIKQKETQSSVYKLLEMMELRQLAGLQIDLSVLNKLKKQTMFGNIYWGEENHRFWHNSIQTTLFAYRILKNAGGYEKELEKITLYFLEQRKDGQWRNTFESALILETILPAFIKTNEKKEPVSIKVNELVVNQFPFDKVIDSPMDLKVEKKGNSAVYFTAYQQFQNPNPKKVEKDFTVRTSLLQKEKLVVALKAGEMTTLKVEVEVKADADYVMIEIPIPAGCSYENKVQHFWGVETHREYFKNKTSIFCTKLKQGKYTFEIDLMPRYSGSYVLNPAKAELMYFPVFYGREGMKKVEIN